MGKRRFYTFSHPHKIRKASTALLIWIWLKISSCSLSFNAAICKASSCSNDHGLILWLLMVFITFYYAKESIGLFPGARLFKQSSG